MNIVNVVSSGSLGQEVNFADFEVLGGLFKPQKGKFPGSYLTLSGAKIILHRSGNFIMTGVKSPEAIEPLREELIALLDGIVDTSLIGPITITNIIAKDTIGHLISLEKFYLKMKTEQIEYEPEVFPGLIWKTEYGVVNLFRSGSFILLGSKNLKDLEFFHKYVTEILEKVLQTV